MDDATFNRKHQFARLFVQSASLAFVLFSVSHLFQCRLCEASSIDKSACKDLEFFIGPGRSCLDGFFSERKDPRDVSASEGTTKPLKEGLIMAVYRVSERERVPFGKDKHGWSITRLCAWYQCEFCPTIFRMQCRSEDKTISCGCKAVEAARKVLTGNSHRLMHGHTGSGTYKSWQGMISRCTYPSHIEYHRYGARGIQVCDSWMKFENFLSDMGTRPDGMSIDRIDPNGNYCPENCRWATASEQARNKRNSRMLTINGVTKCAADWADVDGAASRLNIYNRLHMGWSDEEAVFGRNACRTA